jgi:signal transduction histidine kinase/response regulator RpfG family c-di-GMP phosphodiesterase
MTESNSECILVLAPTGRDGGAACSLLEQAGLLARVCSGIPPLREELGAGAGSAILAEEAFFHTDSEPLFEWVRNQPPWSDFPFIVLTTRGDNERSRQRKVSLVQALRNVTLQERPVQTVTLITAVQAALRSRRRQYEAARYLLEREQAAERLEELVLERTGQLKEANEQLLAAQQSLTMALDAAQMGTWDLDLVHDTARRSARHDRIFGYRSLLPKWSRAIAKKHVLPEDHEAFEAAFRQALETGKFRLECRVAWPDDSVHWVIAEGRLYRDDDGEPARLAGVIADATDRRHAEERLRQAQKLEVIGQLTGGVAHDFNNLLTAVLGNLELAQLRTQDEKLLRILRSAGTAAERGAKLTEQLLAFARKQHLAPRLVDLNELVSHMGDLLFQTIGATARIETILEKDLWAVMIDATQLELVILNLAINARDAMPHGGRLTVATRNIGVSDQHRPEGLAAGDCVAISVKDTGTGMTEEVAAKAFEPFFTTKEVGQGTGLGLSQVVGFAQQSGGEVRIDTRPGHGTTITLYLPRVAGTVEKAQNDERPPPHTGEPATVLVVDDDPDVRELTVGALEALNYSVVEASNGRAALEALKQAGHVDLALIDLVMPGLGGRQLATRIRASHPKLAVLFMSGYDNVLGDGEHLDEEMLLKKPFNLASLAAAVERALDTRPRAPNSGNVTPIRWPYPR